MRDKLAAYLMAFAATGLVLEVLGAILVVLLLS
jgi:hypothetical protein